MGIVQYGQKSLGNVVSDFARNIPWWGWVGGGVMAYWMLKSSGIVSNPTEWQKRRYATGEKLLDDSQIQQMAASIAISAGLAVILWGPPGIGKSEWVYSLARKLNAVDRVVIGSTKEPADIAGILKFDGTTIPPSWARDLRDAQLRGKVTLLFLDEFSAATPLVHSAMLRVVREKVAGDLALDVPASPDEPHRGAEYPYGYGEPQKKFPENLKTKILCAANVAGQGGAAATILPAPAANRLMHLTWDGPSVKEWAIGLIFGWKPSTIVVVPEDWKTSKIFYDTLMDITTYIQRFGQSEVLLKVPTDKAQAGMSWPSPRSWEMAALALGAARYVNAPMDVQKLLVKAAVGDGQADAFFAWIIRKDIPDPEDLLRDPSIWVELTDTDKTSRYMIFVVANSVVSAVLREPSLERFAAALAFFEYVIKTAGVIDVLQVPAMDVAELLKPTGAIAKPWQELTRKGNSRTPEEEALFKTIKSSLLLFSENFIRSGVRQTTTAKRTVTP